MVLMYPSANLIEPDLKAWASSFEWGNFQEDLNGWFFNNEVSQMKKYASIISLLILSFFLLMSCNMGPTKKQVGQAMEAALRSLESSFGDHDDIEVNNIYANAADFVFRNEDGSVITSMNILMREDGVQVYGTSTIAGYADVKSNYIMNGELTYNLWAPPNFNANEAYGEVSGSMMLSGGKIESLAFSVSGDFNGDEDYIVTANDQSIDLNNYDSFFKMIEEITGKVRG
jgi:predicted small secreted protein